MPDHCNKCGIEALEPERFIEERLPFCRPKRYCPACHARLLHRIYFFFAMIVLLSLGVSTIQALRNHRTIFDATGVWPCWLFLIQWLMILPHEMGHALIARVWGYDQIRILVGAGKLLFSARFLGFQWLFNLIPMGGLTLFHCKGALNRWKHLAVVIAGPFVNLAAAGVGSIAISRAALFDSVVTLPELFFWANLIVLAESLFPYVYRTSFGPAPSDGLQLWHLLFRQNRPTSNEPRPIPVWELVLCYVLKWAIFLITLGTTLLLGFIAVWLNVDRPGSASWGVTLSIGLFLLALGALCGWMTFRIAFNPIARTRKPISFGATALSFTPEQMALAQKASEQLRNKDFEAARESCEQAIALIQDKNSEEYLQLLLAKLPIDLQQGKIERAETECREFISADVSKGYKIRLIDGLACLILYEQSSPWLNEAEKFARLGLELAPETVTLKGTLGGVLVEQRKFAEAEPLLRECLERSAANHDQAISSFYLGLVKLAGGKTAEAHRLIRNAKLLYPEPWLLSKAATALKRRTPGLVRNAKAI